jgi:hypothetical protein
MRTFFRGRLAVFFSLLCAAAVIFGNVADARASALSGAQPGDAPYALSVVQNPGPYNCQSRATIEDTIANCDQVKDKDHGLFWKILIAAIIVGILAYLLSRTRFSSGKNPPAEQALLENGPELPLSFPDGSFAVRGFARDGWPIVVDFQPQPGTVTQLEVTVGSGKHAPKRRLILDPDGSHGRQLVKVEMPPAGAAEPKPATYFISSVPIAPLDSDQPVSARATQLQIYGIGGGPRAVGSVAIEQLGFARENPGARFGFFAKSQFSKARAQVQRLSRTGDKTEIVPVFEARQSNLSLGPHGGTWPGNVSGTPTPSKGVHRLQITGWFTTDDRSWVAALAPDLIAQ